MNPLPGSRAHEVWAVIHLIASPWVLAEAQVSQVRDKGHTALGAAGALACLCHLSMSPGPMRVTKKVPVKGFVLQSLNWGTQHFHSEQ